MQSHTKYIIGIDEAGRGPLAGPVAVGVVLVPCDFDWKLIDGVTDSKQLSEKRRECISHNAIRVQQAGLLDYQVSLVGAGHIDRFGIVHALNTAMLRSLNALKRRRNFTCDDVDVRLDGALRAPSSYIHQRTIIRGDATEKSIGLASILAKVRRDQYMRRLAVYHPMYRFEIHKGYGTKSHRNCIAKYGLSNVHRASFCKNLLH